MLEVLLVARGFTWFFGTLWLGFVACLRAAGSLLRLGGGSTKSLRCPRGHEVPVFNVFSCGTCKAAFEGSFLDPCPTCGAEAGWTPCPRCGLSVSNPRLGRRR
jgi:hypothetical protein